MEKGGTMLISALILLLLLLKKIIKPKDQFFCFFCQRLISFIFCRLALPIITVFSSDAIYFLLRCALLNQSKIKKLGELS